MFNALFALGVLLVVAWLYLLPAFIAFNRHTGNRWSVTVVDVFLGFTLLGWVVALAMAVGGANNEDR